MQQCIATTAEYHELYQLHPDKETENRFPFKRRRGALNSRLDVEISVLNTERGGETERPTRMEKSPHESYTKLPQMKPLQSPTSMSTHTHALNLLYWNVSLKKRWFHNFYVEIHTV